MKCLRDSLTLSKYMTFCKKNQDKIKMKKMTIIREVQAQRNQQK